MKNLSLDYNKLFLFIVVSSIIIVSFVLVQPFITAILTAFVLTYIFYPLYAKSENIIRNKSLRSFILILIITIVTLIFLSFITNLLINESVTLYHTFKKADIKELSTMLSGVLGENIDLNLYFKEIVNRGLNFILTSLSDIALTIPQKAISLFIIFFTMYYLFKEGESLVGKFKENLLLKKDHSEKIINKFNEFMQATIYGVIVAAIAQGIIGTIGLFIFRIENPIIWGLVMTITAMFPYFGASIVWFPAALVKLFSGDYFNGIGLIVYGVVIISLIDNILRPKLISARTRIHPIVVLLGVLGGLKLFGFIGLILGPVLLGVLVAVIKIYNLETEKYRKS
ncbi:MAG: AI-2E family transporter [Candidatus Nanoarchaeia archaeon]|jgi:predicted PurR-regulated permease PerM|nr:AI-2E family transporter [Candidatus Nanoarchaeia archaeon]|tara:strand:+ start:18151 stop:19170 length:1020 start_codon:yes stop_codon:yes gene_type:complete